jgi:hypothetical protein
MVSVLFKEAGINGRLGLFGFVAVSFPVVVGKWITRLAWWA